MTDPKCDQREAWAERLARVRRSQERTDTAGMTRPPRDPDERAFLEEQGDAGPFAEDPALPPPAVARRPPLRSEAEYDAATAEIRRLLALDPPAGSEEHARLEVLAALVEAYEAEHDPIEPAAHQQIVDALLEQRGLKRAALADALGGEASVAAFLDEAQPLTRQQAERVAAVLVIPAEVLTRGDERAAWARDALELADDELPTAVAELAELGFWLQIVFGTDDAEMRRWLSLSLLDLKGRTPTDAIREGRIKYITGMLATFYTGAFLGDADAGRSDRRARPRRRDPTAAARASRRLDSRPGDCTSVWTLDHGYFALRTTPCPHHARARQ